jgi:hypothetical protein
VVPFFLAWTAALFDGLTQRRDIVTTTEPMDLYCTA